MPITAILSKRFYDRLGDDVANELVALLNLIDTSYKSELREINDVNFARFEARLDERIEKLRAEVKDEIGKLRAEFVEFKGELPALKEVVERRLGEQTRWMFLVWSAILIPIIGLWFR